MPCQIRRLSNAPSWRVAWSVRCCALLFDTGFNERVLADPLIAIIQGKNSLHYAVRVTPIYNATVRLVRGSRHLSPWQRNMEHLRAVLRSLRVAELTANVSNGSVQLDGWRYGIWASTWGMDRCVPKLIRQLRLRPVQVPRPKRRWDSSWGCRDIIEGLFLIIRTSPARWLISLKRKHPTRSSGQSCAFLSKATYTAFKLYIFCQYVCSLGIEPTTFCAANEILYHWATGTFPDSDTW